MGLQKLKNLVQFAQCKIRKNGDGATKTQGSKCLHAAETCIYADLRENEQIKQTMNMKSVHRTLLVHAIFYIENSAILPSERLRVNAYSSCQ